MIKIIGKLDKSAIIFFDLAIPFIISILILICHLIVEVNDSSKNITVKTSFDQPNYSITIEHPQTIWFDAPENFSFTLNIGLITKGLATPLMITPTTVLNPPIATVQPGITTTAQTTATVTASAPFTSTLPLTLTLQSDAVIFEKTNTATITLPLASDNPLQQIPVRLIPSVANDPLLITVSISDSTNQSHDKQITLQHESKYAYWWRVVITRIFGDSGLTLAAASAIFGIGLRVYDEVRQRTEEEQREQQQRTEEEQRERQRQIEHQREEQIQELQDRFSKGDLIGWLSEADRLREEARNWNEQTRQKLDTKLRHSVERLASDAGVKIQLQSLLRDPSTAAMSAEQLNALFRLTFLAYYKNNAELVQLFTADPQITAETISEELAAQIHVLSLQQAEEVIKVCNILLDAPGSDTWNLVVAIVQNQKTLLEKLQEIVKKEETKETNLAKLALNDPRLRRYLKNLPLAYPPPVMPPSLTAPDLPSQSEQAWLDAHALQYHPFDARVLQTQNEFLARVGLPKEQERTIIDTSHLIVGAGQLDCFAVVGALCRNQPSQPMQLFVPLSLSARHFGEPDSLLSSITRAMSNKWIAWMAEQPGVFLWLPPEQQRALTEWLLWSHQSSLNAIQSRLLTAPDTARQDAPDIAKQELLRRLSELATSAATVTPAWETMLTWLAIRPPQIARLRLLMIDQHRNWNDATMVIEALNDLARADIEWTLFTDPEMGRKITAGKYIDLKWSKKELRDMIDQAVGIAHQRGMKLSDLFNPSNSDLSEGLFSTIYESVSGSLESCLTILRRGLGRHLRLHTDPNHPDYLYLSEQELRAVL